MNNCQLARQVRPRVAVREEAPSLWFAYVLLAFADVLPWIALAMAGAL